MDLKKLKQEQLQLSRKLNLKDAVDIDKIRFVGGIDLTYLEIWKNPTLGIACLVVYDIVEKKPVDVFYAEERVDFPYIPTFLAYRELPLAVKVFRPAKDKVDAVMLDGMGIMHPRRMGIAAHFGVTQDVVSLGCAKSFLVGDYEEPKNEPLAHEPVYIDGELVGYALRIKKNTKPVFVSPGNNISFTGALKLTINCLNGYKIPEPTRLAHNFLQNYRKKLLS